MNSHTKSDFGTDTLRLSQTSKDLVLDFGQIFGILKRGWWLIAVAGFIGTLIAVVLVLRVTPSYSASAQLLLGQKGRVDDAMGAMFPNLRLDDATLSGEIAILTSARLLSQVSKTLDLDNHPEFNPALAPPDDGPDYVELATDWSVGLVKRALGMNTEPPAEQPLDTVQNSAVRDIAMTGKTLLGEQSNYANILAPNLRVSQSGRSNLLTIRYISTDRMLAAAVPNALVDLYLEDQIDRRFEVLSRVASGLEVRLESMRSRLEESERAVIEFRNTGLAEGFGSRARLDQLLADLAIRLSAANAENAELASDLRGIDTMIENQGALATIGLFTSPIIDRLLVNLAELNELADRLGTQFGQDAPRLSELNAEIARVEEGLTAEITRLRDDRARLVELSFRRTSALQAELRTLEQRAISQAEREVQLAQLEREQNAARMVYETFLDRFTETREVVDYQEGDAQVIDYADPPPAPFAPNKKLSAALGGLAGAFIGIALVFILHLNRNHVTTTVGLERLLPAFTVLPMPRVRRLLGRADPLGVALRPIPTPLSETVRSLRSTVLLAATAEQSVIVSVVSPLSGAGKTTTAINLARSIARVGRSCVLVDADLRRGDIAKLMGLQTTSDLNNLLVSRNCDLDAALQKDPETNLNVIVSESGVADPGGALLSKELHWLVARLKDRFEVIVFDTAPLLSGSDALPLVQRSDAVVMVVPRGSDLDEVRIATGKLGKFALKNKSAVLNFVPEKEVGTYYY